MSICDAGCRLGSVTAGLLVPGAAWPPALGAAAATDRATPTAACPTAGAGATTPLGCPTAASVGGAADEPCLALIAAPPHDARRMRATAVAARAARGLFAMVRNTMI